MFTGYQGWLEGIRDWLDVDDYTDAQIASFLALAQIRMNQDLMSTHMEEVVNITIDAAKAGNPIDILVDIPDFNKIRLVTPSWAFRAADVVAINEFKSLVNFYGQDYGANDQNFYCIDAKKLYLWPLAKEGTEIEVRYYVKVPPIDDTLDSNVWTEEHPNILLYAAAVEAAPYMAEDERTPMWAQMYRSLVDNVNDNSTKEKMGSTPLKRQIRGL